MARGLVGENKMTHRRIFSPAALAAAVVAAGLNFTATAQTVGQAPEEDRGAAEGGGPEGAVLLSGRDFLARIEAGDVWCLDPRPSARACRFILRAPSLHLAADGAIFEGVGYWLLPVEGGGFVKQEQLFFYYVANEQVCLNGPEVQLEHMRFFAPASACAGVGGADQRMPPEEENRLRSASRAAWAQYTETCWGYGIDERIAELEGPEIVMQRYHSGLAVAQLRVGVFFDPAEAESWTLYVLE